jgi:hypothetical protein
LGQQQEMISHRRDAKDTEGSEKQKPKSLCALRAFAVKDEDRHTHHRNLYSVLLCNLHQIAIDGNSEVERRWESWMAWIDYEDLGACK